MSAWILEMRPKEWDVDKFLRAVARGNATADLAWPVDDHADKIKEGDRVYLGRAGATCRLDGDPGRMLGMLIRGPVEGRIREILVNGRPGELKARVEGAS